MYIVLTKNTEKILVLSDISSFIIAKKVLNKTISH